MTSPAPILRGLPEQLDELFDRATAATKPIRRRYEIAGLTVEFRFAGAALVSSMTRALAHLASPSQRAPSLVVKVWDAASSGVEPPPLPDQDGPVLTGTSYYTESERLQAAYRPGVHMLSVLDHARGVAWSWARDEECIPHWDRAAPIRQLLHWWLGSRRIQLLHGGAIGSESGGVLLVGRGGSGKSTTALSALLDGLRYCGDDYVAVGLEPSPFVHSLYSSGKLDPDHLRRLPKLVRAVANGDRLDAEKAIVYAHEVFPARTLSGLPLRAVVVPRVTGGVTTRAVPIPAAAALAALAPSTILQLHPPAPDALAFMGELVRRLPAFSLELGSDLDAIPVAVTDLLTRLEG